MKEAGEAVPRYGQFSNKQDSLGNLIEGLLTLSLTVRFTTDLLEGALPDIPICSAKDLFEVSNCLELLRASGDGRRGQTATKPNS